MHLRNVHEREFPLSLAAVGALIDSLASRDDRLWPNGKWPPMRFDRPLAIGAVGGHGPVRYSVVEYRPSQSILSAFQLRAALTERISLKSRIGRGIPSCAT